MSRVRRSSVISVVIQSVESQRLDDVGLHADLITETFADNKARNMSF